MCDNVEHGGVRCPSDTSEARQLRRKSVGARQAFQTLAQKPVESKALPETDIQVPPTVESVREDITALHDLLNGTSTLGSPAESSSERNLAVDKQINLVGSGILHLAEKEFGAPTDAELAETQQQYEAEALEAAKQKDIETDSRIDEYNKEREALLEELRDGLNESAYNSLQEYGEAEKPALWKKYVKAENRYNSALLEKGKAQKGVDDAVREAMRPELEKRNVAMKAALETVGVQFADPETLKYSEDSSPDAVTSLKSALSYYPQEWIDTSNNAQEDDGNQLKVRRTTSRAHYAANVEQDTFTQYPLASVLVKPADWKPDPHSLDGSRYVDLGGATSWTDPDSGKVFESSIGPNDTDKRAWLYPKYQESDKPKRGFTAVEVWDETYDANTGTFVRNGKRTIYRKKSYKKVQTGTIRNDEIVISKENVRVGNDKGFRVAIHEFAHRVEDTSPKIKVFEDVFLRRRAGHLKASDDFTTEPEKMTPIDGLKNEHGFKDNFPTHYMGKVYSDGSREILAMGMESLFAGENGSLSGLNGFKPDPDYKKFVLGVLATAKTK